jgi:putative two-component system response regulator
MIKLTSILASTHRMFADKRILTVDDAPTIRTFLCTVLEGQGAHVEEAACGEEAVAMLALQPGEEQDPRIRWDVSRAKYDLILLDLLMPDMDGIQVLQRIRASSEVPAIVMLTSAGGVKSATAAVQLGADGYIEKHDLSVGGDLSQFFYALERAMEYRAGRIAKAHLEQQLHDQEQMYRQQLEEYNRHLESRVREQVQQISSAHLATIFALAKLAETGDSDLGAHLERIREYSKILARHLGRLPKYASVLNPTYVENLYAASPLHDIGKVAIPDQILLKPGKLTVEEFAAVRIHPVIGANTLLVVDQQYPGNAFVHMGIEIAASHHEKWDGTGYPRRLGREDIPLSGRILALADVYDALTSKRRYKEAFSHQESIETILREQGKQFDPDIVDCFLAAEQEFQSVRKRFR